MFFVPIPTTNKIGYNKSSRWSSNSSSSSTRRITITIIALLSAAIPCLLVTVTAFSLAHVVIGTTTRTNKKYTNNHNHNYSVIRNIGIGGSQKRQPASTTTIATGVAAATTTTSVLAHPEHRNTNNNDDKDDILPSQENKVMTTTTTTTNNNNVVQWFRRYYQTYCSSPRVRSCVLMSCAMSLHFGGYEFARSAALALFTSSNGITGCCTSPSAYPFAISCVTPTTLALLYWYGTIVQQLPSEEGGGGGPRKALRQTTMLVLSVLFLGCTSIATLSSAIVAIGGGGGGTLALASSSSSSMLLIMIYLTKAITACLFVFQNSYAHLIYTQQWSFLGSVMTPLEGTKWFTFIAGFSSIVCTLTASSVSKIAKVFNANTNAATSSNNNGLTFLLFLTCVTLGASMVCSDRAYQLSTEYGFDPSDELQKQKQKQKTTATNKEQITTAINNNDDDNNNSSNSNKKEVVESLMGKTKRLFRTSPTLVGLFGEVITFQALSTVLNVCFVRQMKENIPNDTNRAAFMGNFFAGVNGVSSVTQFFVWPFLRKYLEPQWVYRFLPLLLMPLLSYGAFWNTAVASTTAIGSSNGLWIAAIAFFVLKSTDYSVRNLANEMVYQPLNFDARYLGKEVIGVFANRFGKSGTSIILAGLTTMFGFASKSSRPLSQLAVGVGAVWSACSIYLSNNVITNKQAEELVVQRQRRGTADRSNISSNISCTTSSASSYKIDTSSSIVNVNDDSPETTGSGRIKED